MLIGIDVGGTKTHIRVVGLPVSGAVDARVSTPSWLAGRRLDDARSVAALLALLDDAGADRSAPLAIGAHGCDTEQQVEAFRAALAAQHPGPVLVVNDALLVGPAAGVDEFVGVIIGTGSIVVGRDVDGRTVSAGGHGWMIADPGSAPALTREAAKAVARRADEGLPPDELGRALMSAFGLADPNELPMALTLNADIHAWARTAPLVFDAAAAGSADAAETIAAAAAELAEQIAHVLARGAVAEAVIAAGGVIVNQAPLQDELRAALASRGIDLPMVVLDGDPVAGAVALARRLDERAPEASSDRRARVASAN
jgi:N-acetylglucosamine kinase-like BadF-type ATPase